MSTPSTESDPTSEAGTETDAPSQEALDRFPVMIGVLEEYFVNGDRSVALMKKYHRVGEASTQFVGLSDELLDAVRHSTISTPVVNHVLGSQVTPAEVREMFSALRDQLLQQGDFNPEIIEENQEEERAERRNARPEPSEMVQEYAARKFAIPLVPWFRDHAFPLYYYLVVGVLVLGLGIALGQIPWPSWMGWFPNTFIALGGILAGFAAIAMVSIRGEIVNPETEQEREGRAEFHSKREAKRESRRSSSKKSLGARVRGMFG